MTNKPHVKTVFTERQALEIMSPIIGGCRAGGLRYAVCGGLRRKRDRVGVVHLCVEDLPRFDMGITKLVEAGRYAPDHVYRCTKKDVREAKRYEYVIETLRVLVFDARPDHWGSMVLYLTGNDVFNRLIRAEAKSQLMRLNQYGLFFHGEIVAGKSEHQIFYALGLDYVKPENREAGRDFRFSRSGVMGGSNVWTSYQDKIIERTGGAGAGKSQVGGGTDGQDHLVLGGERSHRRGPQGR